jgi:hypothetical protein
MLPNLTTALLDLLHEVQETEVKLIVGGGFGIFLRTVRVQRSGERTLLQETPEARSTNDLDLFLRPELLIDAQKLKPLAEALVRLNYQPVRGAEKYQFLKTITNGTIASSLKIDILTGPVSHFNGTSVKADKRRARPNPSIDLHAHPTDEALTLDRGLLPETITGVLSSGHPWKAEVFLPNAYTFLMMKLFAFRDRLDDKNKQFGSYHALDMYTILATTTEREWAAACDIRDSCSEETMVIEAGKLIKQHFSAQDQFGILRLKESLYYRPELQISDFMSILQELFPSV